MINLLLIDNNPDLVKENILYFNQKDFNIKFAENGREALELIKKYNFHCIILETALPDIDGFKLYKIIRKFTIAPIVFLTYLDGFEEKTKEFVFGNEDYITKPFKVQELYHRIHVLITRNIMIGKKQDSSRFMIDYENRMIYTKEKNVILTRKEFELFLLFYKNPNIVFTKKDILEKVWLSSKNNYSTVAVHVLKLRRKIFFAESILGKIVNEYANGYVFLPTRT